MFILYRQLKVLFPSIQIYSLISWQENCETRFSSKECTVDRTLSKMLGKFYPTVDENISPKKIKRINVS